jgi:hypothetical protein
MLPKFFRRHSQPGINMTLIKKLCFPVIDAHDQLGEPFGGGCDKKTIHELVDLLDEELFAR